MKKPTMRQVFQLAATLTFPFWILPFVFFGLLWLFFGSPIKELWVSLGEFYDEVTTKRPVPKGGDNDHFLGVL